MISNIIKQASSKENTEELKTFWLKKYTELTESNYFVLSPKTIELALEKEVVRPATPFGDLVLMTHLDESGEINENLLQNNIEIAVRLLDACLDVIAFDKNSTKVINQYRKIGLGIADFGQYYKNLKRENNQTNEAEEIEYIGNLVSNNAYRSSESLSEEKGICQSWDNIKKILRDKPFEYWYNTENGDIKTSSEMIANFDQNRIEASDFEIVPRRNSHMMLLPAVDEWQVWSDRSPMTISQLNSNSLVNNLPNSNSSENQINSQTENVQNLNSDTKQNSENNSTNSDQSLVNNSEGNGIGKSGITIISFPKNKMEKLEPTEEIQKVEEKDLEQNVENSLEENASNTLPKINQEENSSLSNSPKLEHSQLLELETKTENLERKAENRPELEMQNSQNFFEKPTNLENLETLTQNENNSEFGFENKIDEEKIPKNQEFEVSNYNNLETLQDNLATESELELSSQQKPIDKSLIKEMVSSFGQTKFTELSNKDKDNLQSIKPNEKEKLENTTENENAEKNNENPLMDEFQLGELVRIVKKDSPSFGQIQQIIEIDEQNSDDSNKTSLKLSGVNNQNLLFGQNEIEPMDLHDFLDQTNFANEQLARGDNNNLNQINLNNQENSQFLSENKQGNLQKYLEEIANLEKEIENTHKENETLKQEKIQNLDKIKTLETQIEQEKLQNQEFSKVIQSQKAEIDKLKEELNSTRQELKNVPNLEKEKLFDQNFGQNFGNVNFANLGSNAQTKNTTNFDNTNELNSENQNHAQELQNLLHQNNSENNSQNSESNFTNKITNNFFKLQNKFISFMSKYSLQLQQLASTNGQFKLGDILITLQYDGSGVKLVSASGDQLSKELKHMVDTVLGIVNKSLAFGVPANELAKQMKLEPKDDEIETPLNHILAVVAAALEEAPGQIQNLKAESLFGIDKKDVEAFTVTTKSDSMSILMSKLQELKGQKINENGAQTNSQFQNNSDQKFEPKMEKSEEINSQKQADQNPEKNQEKPQNNTNPFTRSEDKNEEKIPNSQNSNAQDDNEEKSKQEEKPRSFFGGFGGRN